jgi:putative heme transporter
VPATSAGRRPERVVVVGRWVLTRANRVRHRHPAAGADVLDELLAQLRSVRPSGRDWTVATGFALLNWAFDAGRLAACAGALSVHGLTLPLLLVAYTAGMASSVLSLVPGGIGVVEAALVLALVAGGVPAAAALPAVLLYRLISLVGIVGAGWMVFAVQQLRATRSPSQQRHQGTTRVINSASRTGTVFRRRRPASGIPGGLPDTLARGR